LLDAGPHVVSVGDGGPDFGPAVVPPGHYLVMGDNRGDSKDGRMFGWVRREAILGRAEAVYARDGSLTWLEL
jgi:signal peptidase I